MFLTKKHLSRRTVLKGAGASIALPLLDAMIPARTALAKTAAAPKARLGFVYFPHGAVCSTGPRSRPGATSSSAPSSSRSNPCGTTSRSSAGCEQGRRDSFAPHATTEQAWLCCVTPQQRAGEMGISVDQVAARHIGQDTPLPSLEMSCEVGGYSSLSYRTANQQLEMEANPRKLFYQLFGEGDTRAERERIAHTTGSLLDYVANATTELNREVDARDRVIVGDYLDWCARSSGACRSSRQTRGMRVDLPEAPWARRMISRSCSTCSWS